MTGTRTRAGLVPDAVLANTRGAELGVAALRRLGERTGFPTWPVVLDLWPTDDDAELSAAADRAADRELEECGALVDDRPDHWSSTAVRVLTGPERELAVRVFGADGPRRACLARRGHEHVLAVRTGDRIALGFPEIADAAGLGAVIRALCGQAPPMTFADIRVPTDEFVDRLARCGDRHDAAAVLRTIGARADDATRLAAALAAPAARTEIVAIAHGAGVVTQSCGALAVVDGERGRIVLSPSGSLDGGRWTTLTPGTGHRLAQGVRLLVETLPDGRWFP
ncbi:ESX secretion-associated protein EspG [Gordonia sp. NB41Y]|uniref:ESX secretion-associated protein EspG n=1 Tax=Gordonia sp. NB41Y TaxID=875808 RepID=UPI0006C43D06|nr:ESX secretion-associated protein EspG [Gordonia sp. NB41Y]EMP11466.2 hypothetical protein ISGA_5251 [Gordonia sp. NB41Y]WLP89772.1 ESX secretion-associated protein EspG [Gordonia sp. NB41Y]